MTTTSTPDGFATWRAAYLAAIVARLRTLGQDGTTGIGTDNLFQCVRVPLVGGPTGPNCRWIARETFNELLAKLPANLKSKLL